MVEVSNGVFGGRTHRGAVQGIPVSSCSSGTTIRDSTSSGRHAGGTSFTWTGRTSGTRRWAAVLLSRPAGGQQQSAQEHQQALEKRPVNQFLQHEGTSFLGEAFQGPTRPARQRHPVWPESWGPAHFSRMCRGARRVDRQCAGSVVLPSGKARPGTPARAGLAGRPGRWCRPPLE